MLEVDPMGFDEVRKVFASLAKEQIPYAMMTMLNNSAFNLQKTSRDTINAKIDRPVPFIAKSTAVTSRVYIGNNRKFILAKHEYGGARGLQGLERLLRGKGLLKAGQRAIPSKDMGRDAYGNPARRSVNAIKQWITSGMPKPERTTRSGRAKRKVNRKFVISSDSRGGLLPGIWEEMKVGKQRRLFLWYMFDDDPRYGERLNWGAAMIAAAGVVLATEAAVAIRRAIATAR
jgi:hypothetical protein